VWLAIIIIIIIKNFYSAIMPWLQRRWTVCAGDHGWKSENARYSVNYDPT